MPKIESRQTSYAPIYNFGIAIRFTVLLSLCISGQFSIAADPVSTMSMEIQPDAIVWLRSHGNGGARCRLPRRISREFSD